MLVILISLNISVHVFVKEKILVLGNSSERWKIAAQNKLGDTFADYFLFDTILVT